ncbi:hypothetical protein [Puniceibacterium sp. IMCC21224]|uniref:hypothetical protein n=1 Tax=Puniceibacterium sp. IMCC21224 TaxID=1618204 RepID=UPI00064D7FAE|nr:hypothetical protein [Puniceibacterium sp. IMCC21224]KMK68551.1 hypothetical protein IMCC21224_113434 [Puniceibacterium sp. IMCC21224]
MSVLVSKTPQDMDSSSGLAEMPILPAPAACAELRYARGILKAAYCHPDDLLRAAAVHLRDHGDWMDVQSATQMLRQLEERAAEARIEVALIHPDTAESIAADIDRVSLPPLWMCLAFLIWAVGFAWMLALLVL